MSKKILLTTTSFQDTPGKHHDVLAKASFEVVTARGPLSEQQMLDLIAKNQGFDGLLNGDDRITAKVIEAALPRLKVIAKYGIGLDSIDVLEIALIVSKQYGIVLRADNQENERIFRSLRLFSQYVATHRTK